MKQHHCRTQRTKPRYERVQQAGAHCVAGEVSFIQLSLRGRAHQTWCGFAAFGVNRWDSWGAKKQDDAPLLGAAAAAASWSSRFQDAFPFFLLETRYLFLEGYSYVQMDIKPLPNGDGFIIMARLTKNPESRKIQN